MPSRSARGHQQFHNPRALDAKMAWHGGGLWWVSKKEGRDEGVRIVGRELDQLGRFLTMVAEHKHAIGFDGTILIEPGIDAVAAAGAAIGGRLHLAGGGARSPAYRQVTSDCWGAPVRVPDAEEAVATGACVQAAPHLGMGISDTAEAWHLGAGPDVEPAPNADAAAIRAAYRHAARSSTG